MVWYTQVALGGENDVQETWLRLASPVVMSREESQGGPGARVMSVCPGLLGKKMELLFLIFSCKIRACDSGYKSFWGLPPSLRVLHCLLVRSGKDETTEHSHVNFLIVFFCSSYFRCSISEVLVKPEVIDSLFFFWKFYSFRLWI